MYGKTTTALGAAVLALTCTGYAHMILANPIPYGSPDNSPLDPSGYNYPCKNVYFTVTQENMWEVGSTQTLI